MEWLNENGWDIICFDFPQSGTGRVLHPSNTTSKTEGAIIPDIVAVKNGIVLDFENKDKFVRSDFEKVATLKSTDIYDESFAALLRNYPFSNIYYGIGMLFTENNFKKSEELSEMVDFIVYLKDDGTFQITDNIGGLF